MRPSAVGETGYLRWNCLLSDCPSTVMIVSTQVQCLFLFLNLVVQTAESSTESMVQT